MTSPIKSKTNKAIVIPILALIVVSFQVLNVRSQLIDCASLMMKVAKSVMKVYGKCSKDFMQIVDDDQLEYQRRMDCVMKCVMDKIGLLDEFDKVSNDTMQIFLDKYIPEDYHEIAQILVEGCIEDYSPLMNNEEEDDTCLAYGGFVTCVQGIIAEAC